MNVKAWYTSTTIQAGALAVLTGLVQLVGAWGSWLTNGAKISDLFVIVWPAILGLVTIIGRLKATGPISGTAAHNAVLAAQPTPPPAVTP